MTNSIKNIELKTKRLNLIPFGSKDHRLFLDLNNDPYIRKYLWDDELIDQSTVQEIISQNDKHFKADKYGIWKVQLSETNEILGYAGLWYFFDEPQPQLIYALLEKFTKKGYAREAGLSIIKYAFEKLDFKYLIAATDELNSPSVSVALGLGMEFVEKRIENDKPTLFYSIENKLINNEI